MATQKGDIVDEVVDALSASLEVSKNNSYDEHPRFSQFKNYGQAAERQKVRREEWMQRQKELVHYV
jgi:hypothetical protein